MFVIVSLKDSAAGSFAQPMLVRSLALAERSLRDEVNRADANNPIHNHPGDFSLYHCGTFDEDTGVVESCDPPVLFAQAKDLKNPA